MTIEPGSLRGIHLDLKYHMPKKEALLDWLNRLPGYGINALLIEYEDKFPFERYPFLSDPDAFTAEELTAFLATARGLGITVIPLVQTFAHLEFALGHPELAHLRESPENYIKMCSCNPEAVQFVHDLVDEVLAFHEADELFHIGGDEVWHTGWCDACQAELDRAGVIPMWTAHMNRYIDQVAAVGKRAIIWDDILWQDFEAINSCGLREGTILHAWNYNITSLEPKGGDSSDAEFGGAAGVLKQAEIYRKAGYDFVGCPCINYGQLFSRHSISLKNTQVWAKKVAQAGGLGILNSSWAVFHVPLPSQNIYLAATGRLVADADAGIESDWQDDWFGQEFGCSAEGAGAAFETLGELWEIPMPEYGRNFTPLVYCYMNMVLHYPGRQEERKRRGAYPLEWESIDFDDIFRKGIEGSRDGQDMNPVFERLDKILAEYPVAVATLEALATAATVHRDEAEMLAVCARFKTVCARVVSRLLREDGDRDELLAAIEKARSEIAKVLPELYEPVGAARMLRAWESGLGRALF